MKSMESPRVDPVGVPDGFVQAPRQYAAPVRWAAGLIATSMLVVVVVTTAISLGEYCLTTDAGNPSALPYADLPGR